MYIREDIIIAPTSTAIFDWTKLGNLSKEAALEAKKKHLEHFLRHAINFKIEQIQCNPEHNNMATLQVNQSFPSIEKYDLLVQDLTEFYTTDLMVSPRSVYAVSNYIQQTLLEDIIPD